MSLIRRWKTVLNASLCLVSTGVVACSGEGQSTSTLSADSNVVHATTGSHGVALLGGQERVANMVSKDDARSALQAPAPVMLGASAVPTAGGAAQPSSDLGPIRTRTFGLETSAVPSPPPTTTFLATGTSGTPPDTMGAVGPNHVVTFINFRVVIQSRSGTTLSNVSLNSFFSSVLPTGNSGFDPRVAYDASADRWILTCPSGVSFTGNSTTLLAVSQTGDPTGAWNFYAIPADPDGLRWADHNGLGYNSKWILIHSNMVPFDGSGADARQHFFAIDKAALYAGSPSVSYTLLVGDGWQSTPAATYDPNQPDLYLLETQCRSCGTLRLRRITGPVGSEVLEDFPSITVDPWGPGLNVPQQGSSVTLNFTLDWIQNVVVRNGSIWATHQVGAPASSPTHTAIRWMQIDPSTRDVVQLGTLDDPSGVNNYGYPSIAVNADDDVLIGYSRTSDAQYVSADYAARDATDPPGTLRGDHVYKAGETVYENGDPARWGDYSNTVVDPVDDLSMWTIQQIAALPGPASYALWWAHVPAPTPAVDCTLETATDLGPRTTLATVASDACVKVSQYPDWWNFTSGDLTLQSGTGSFPVAATWEDSCTGESQPFSFTTAWESVPVGSHTSSCPVLIELQGSGAPLQITWW